MKHYSKEEFRKVWTEGSEWSCHIPGHTPCWYTSPPSFNCEPGYRYWLKKEPSISEVVKEYVKTLPKNDEVNKPSHYVVTIKGVEIDCRDVQKALGMYQHHCLASAFKYVWRALHKGATEKDIKKAINFLQEELKIREST
jgi:hypothetical protein